MSIDKSHRFIHMSIHMSIRMFTQMSVHMSTTCLSHVYTHVCPYTCLYIRARKYLTVTVKYGTCTMPIWLTAMCPKTLIVTPGDVLESGNAKNRVNLTCSVCARCGDEVLCGAQMPFLDVCKWVRVNERKIAKSCTQIQEKWSSRSTFSPTMQKTRCG